MTGYKNAFKSKTIWGGLLVIVSTATGLTIQPSDVNVVIDNLSTIVTAVGGILAIWGRVNARQMIG